MKTSEVTLDITKRLVGLTILIELSLGPSAILPLALIEGLRPDAERESLFVGFSSVDMVLLLMRCSINLGSRVVTMVLCNLFDIVNKYIGVACISAANVFWVPVEQKTDGAPP